MSAFPKSQSQYLSCFDSHSDLLSKTCAFTQEEEQPHIPHNLPSFHLPPQTTPSLYTTPIIAAPDTDRSAFETHSAASSTVADNIKTPRLLPQKLVTPMDRKRKNGDGSSLASPDANESGGYSKQRKCNNGSGRKAGGGKKTKTEKKDGQNQNVAETEEPPAGYIHVRARRGQATDSHSLAERIRREKISERMTVLQTLVPGCDKVTGKALMLDEIINYVQSLQNQVEFLSMKLASVNPVLYDFGMDPEVYISRPEILNGLVSQAEVAYMPPCNKYQASAGATTAANPILTARNCSFIPLDKSSPLLLEQEQHGNASLVHLL